ncbi:isopentenyl-diphosphate delta-isomerase [archaeon]|nr:MAG: isopentenyl-diphosphate delta-isomerase [archaeon]
MPSDVNKSLNLEFFCLCRNFASASSKYPDSQSQQSDSLTSISKRMARSSLCCSMIYLIELLVLVKSYLSSKMLFVGFNSHRAKSFWDPDGLSQKDLLHFDECILVDKDDTIIGHDTKYSAHLFSSNSPEAKLHRAFSVFVFNNQGQLLLQQRAKSKVTFPLVWTNTCCSHPLFGCTPNEVDSAEDIETGRIPGMRAAAIRKLQHELGISSALINPNSFKFLTRIHYCAKDELGPESDKYWGEHEIDYILFLQGDFPYTPNPDEIETCKYVSKEELFSMLEDTKYRWSPWFRVIANKFLRTWWDNLEDVWSTDRFHDHLLTIHRV